MHPVMSFDDVAWVRSERIVDNWIYQFCRPEIGGAAAQTPLEYHSPGEPVDFTVIGKGSYNIFFRVKFENAPAVVIRYPLPATLRFPDEKIRNEAAVMRYLREHTSIPSPRVIHQGRADGSQLSMGQFIIMEYARYDSKMDASLNTPGRPADLRGILDPDITEEKLEMLSILYRQLTDVLLKLPMLSFSRIGSLQQKNDSMWEVTCRPLTLNMEQIVVMGTLAPTHLPARDATFATSASYLESVAESFVQHLNHQRNDAIESADDCRRKFVARKLFQRLAKERTLTNSSLANGPCKLWCDDLRPANVIMDQDDHIVGVLDWEFSYADPPWWLLIEKPEYWAEGLDDWAKVGEMSEGQRLSGPMKDSWESGDFWIMYAGMHSFAFDAIYWQKIDQRFFGQTNDPENTWKERLVLLSDYDHLEMEKLVTRELGDMKHREIAWGCDE